MSYFIPYSDSSTYYSYSPEITLSVETDKHRKYKIESVPVTSSYYLPNSIYDTSYFYPTNYSYPVYQNISYLDVNQDKDLHKKVTKHFFSQLYNRWIPELYPNLLNYLKVSNNEVHLVKSIADAKNNTTKESDFSEKINYIADFILTKKDLFELLSVYSDRKNIKWWNLRQYSEDVELYVIKRLEQKLKEMVLE
jgi:hypothetical protein